MNIFSDMANRRLYRNIQPALRLNILTNISKCIGQMMPAAVSVTTSMQIRYSNFSSASDHSELPKIPRINLEKPTRPYQPRRALM